MSGNLLTNYFKKFTLACGTVGNCMGLQDPDPDPGSGFGSFHRPAKKIEENLNLTIL